MTENEQLTPSPPKVPSHKLTFLLLILFTLGALVLSAIALIATYQQTHYVQHRFGQQATDSSQVLSQLTTLTGSQQHIQNRIGDNLLHIKTLQQQMTAVENQVQKGGDQEWILAEAQYLVQLANYNVDIQKNAQIAAKLLQIAHQRLSAVVLPGLASVKQSLANDLVTLHAVPTIDLEDILQQLTALDHQIDQLPLPTPNDVIQTEQPTIKDQKPVIDVKNWRRELNKTWQQLQKMVVIRHADHPITPLLAPNQQAYLLQNLHLLLQRAQWAAIYQHPVIYHDSLEQAITLITHHFAAKTPQAMSVITALNTLAKINIAPKLPDLSATLLQLEKLQHTVYRPTTLHAYTEESTAS